MAKKKAPQSQPKQQQQAAPAAPSSSSSERSIRTRFNSKDEACELHFLPPSSADRSPLMAWRNVPTPTSTSALLLESQQDYGEEQESSSDDGSAVHDRDGRGPRRRKARTINHITLGFIAYFAVAAGPFGVEDAVRAAGAYPVLLAVVILPFTWGLPQALMVRLVVALSLLASEWIFPMLHATNNHTSHFANYCYRQPS